MTDRPAPSRRQAPGMAVYDQTSGAFLGTVAERQQRTCLHPEQGAGKHDRGDAALVRLRRLRARRLLWRRARAGLGPPERRLLGQLPMGFPQREGQEQRLLHRREHNTGLRDCEEHVRFHGKRGLQRGRTRGSCSSGTPTPDYIAKASGGLGNVWSQNAYIWSGSGRWQFWAAAQGNEVTRSQWQAAPYGQDTGSTFR